MVLFEGAIAAIVVGFAFAGRIYFGIGCRFFHGLGDFRDKVGGAAGLGAAGVRGRELVGVVIGLGGYRTGLSPVAAIPVAGSNGTELCACTIFHSPFSLRQLSVSRQYISSTRPVLSRTLT